MLSQVIEGLSGERSWFSFAEESNGKGAIPVDLFMVGTPRPDYYDLTDTELRKYLIAMGEKIKQLQTSCISEAFIIAGHAAWITEPKFWIHPDDGGSEINADLTAYRNYSIAYELRLQSGDTPESLSAMKRMIGGYEKVLSQEQISNTSKYIREFIPSCFKQ